MARPRTEPTTSINLFATRTERTTPVRYTETPNFRYDTVDASSTDEAAALIRLQLLGILEHRDVALRAVSTACKLVTPRPQGPAWNEFQMQVVSAVGEAFNNIVLHGYANRKEGSIDLRIQTRRGYIRIELRDWGSGFDPTGVPPPAFDTLPESGLGLFIMQSFMEMAYRLGRPNLLTLSKRFVDRSSAARKSEGAT
ncbi:MAG TPA: ATP-binding protein [Polyangia bacterium]|nr:ATP-binding protein [Polyangia bacterium]